MSGDGELVNFENPVDHQFNTAFAGFSVRSDGEFFEFFWRAQQPGDGTVELFLHVLGHQAVDSVLDRIAGSAAGDGYGGEAVLHGFLNDKALGFGDAGEGEEVRAGVVLLDFVSRHSSDKLDPVADAEPCGEGSHVVSVGAVADHPEAGSGVGGGDVGNHLDQGLKVFLFSEAAYVEQHLVVGRNSQIRAGFCAVDGLRAWDSGGNDVDGAADSVAFEPAVGGGGGGDDLLAGVVIEVGVLGDAEPDVAAWEHPEVVGVPVVEGVVGADQRDLVALGPAHSDEADDPGGVGVDDVELVLAKGVEHPPEGRVGERIALGPGGLDGAEPVGVRVLFAVPDEVGGKQVDAVTSIS